MPDRQHERWNFTEFSNATPESVCEGYCLLSGYVASELFGFRIPADCFCHLSDGDCIACQHPDERLDCVDEADKETRRMRFRYEKSVYDFVVSAVNDRLEKERDQMMPIPGSVIALANGCSCPDYDNRDRPAGAGWIVTTDCQIHGFNGTHPRVVKQE